jgi:pyruvate formate lyase activating enzyme
MSLEVLNNKEKLRSLKQVLHQYTVPAAEALIERHDNGDVRCYACGHRCLIQPGRDGVCRVRYNDNGVLRVPHGYVAHSPATRLKKSPSGTCSPAAMR